MDQKINLLIPHIAKAVGKRLTREEIEYVRHEFSQLNKISMNNIKYIVSNIKNNQFDIQDYLKKNIGTTQEDNEASYYNDVNSNSNTTSLSTEVGLFLHFNKDDLFKLSREINPASKYTYNYIMIDSNNYDTTLSTRTNFRWYLNDGPPIYQNGYINLHSKLNNVVMMRLGRITLSNMHVSDFLLIYSGELRRVAVYLDNFKEQALLSPAGYKYHFSMRPDKKPYGNTVTLSGFFENRGWFRFRQLYQNIDQLSIKMHDIFTPEYPISIPETAFTFRAYLLLEADFYVTIGLALYGNPIIIEDNMVPYLFAIENASTRYTVDNSNYIYVRNVFSWNIQQPPRITLTGSDYQFRGIEWSRDLSIYCIVGTSANGYVLTSPDGVTWTARTPSANNAWQSVVWASSITLFAAVSSNGTNRVMTSPNGTVWTARSASAANPWISITWSESLTLFVAVAQQSSNTAQVMTSSNGTAWTSRTGITGITPQEITWSEDASIFVVVGTNGIMSSTDGTTWTQRKTDSINWRSVAWSKQLNKFCAISDSTSVATSTDGITWTETSTGYAYEWQSITWADQSTGHPGYFCAVGTSIAGIMISLDGVAWTLEKSQQSNNYSIVWSIDRQEFCIAASTTFPFILTSTYIPENNRKIHAIGTYDFPNSATINNATISNFTTDDPATDAATIALFNTTHSFLVFGGTSDTPDGQYIIIESIFIANNFLTNSLTTNVNAIPMTISLNLYQPRMTGVLELISEISPDEKIL